VIAAPYDALPFALEMYFDVLRVEDLLEAVLQVVSWGVVRLCPLPSLSVSTQVLLHGASSLALVLWLLLDLVLNLRHQALVVAPVLLA
jgi:Na+/serine symporter